MAYDKVIDSAAVEAGLTQIADAIREKSGTSGLLGFPTAMAAAIAAIQTGGGMASPINFDLSVGTFIVAEEVTTLNIQCDFPVKSTDSFAIFYAAFPSVSAPLAATFPAIVSTICPPLHCLPTNTVCLGMQAYLPQSSAQAHQPPICPSFPGNPARPFRFAATAPGNLPRVMSIFGVL